MRLPFCPHRTRRRASLGSVRTLHSAVSAPKSFFQRHVFPAHYPTPLNSGPYSARLARRSTVRLLFCQHSARRRAALGFVRTLHSAVSAPKFLLHRHVFAVQHPGCSGACVPQAAVLGSGRGKGHLPHISVGLNAVELCLCLLVGCEASCRRQGTFPHGTRPKICIRTFGPPNGPRS